MQVGRLSLVVVALAVQLAQATLYQSVGAIPQNKNYDYIIVGGGTAGAVIGSRLSENSRNKVLIVEAGPNNEGVEALEIPGYAFGRIPNTYSWNYTTEPTAGLNGRTQTFDRGYVLGGSSCVNGMLYTRGAKDDYDSWARTTGDIGWSWINILRLFLKVDAPSWRTQHLWAVNPLFHGFLGRTRVSLPQSGPDDFDNRCVQTTQQLGSEFPFNLDPNSGTPIGLTWSQSTIGNGERSSSSRAYLDAGVRARSNLDIVVNAYATRVLRTGTGSPLTIRTVELATEYRGTGRRTLTAAKEVILSAGATNTPQILLNSGIGDSAALTALGIPVVRNLPDVGKNMADHATTIALWTIVDGVPFPTPDPDAALTEWRNSRSGPLTEFVRRQVVWTRIKSDHPIFQAHGPDPSAGRNSPHIELALFTDGAVAGASVVLLTPKSRGSITLRSTDPFDPPKIELGYFTHPFDLEALKEGNRMAKRFFSAPAWSGFIGAPITSDPDTDPAWEESTRNFVVSTLHPVGTAAMSRRGANTGVLDPDLRVKGVRGLRVADASSIPLIPTGHTQAAVYALAERAAEIIRLS